MPLASSPDWSHQEEGIQRSRATIGVCHDHEPCWLVDCEKILLDFERLTRPMRGGLASGTSNPVENCYGHTGPCLG
ncbi:MAG: hypothetical protein U9N12_06615 [Euryarchaeota archaeon]|nr:hypothetical protein [Euryarchaeota archaeon]